MNKLLKNILILGSLITFGQSYAQDFTDLETTYIKSKISAKNMCGEKLRCGSVLVSQFYKSHNYAPVWVKNDDLTDNGNKMVGIINNAYLDGLDPRAYHSVQINKLVDEINNTDDKAKLAKLLASLDMALTDGYFLYATNLHYGLMPSKKVFQYWTTGPRPVNLINSLNDALSDDSLNETISSLAPRYPGYNQLKAKMNQYQNVAIHGGWESIPDGEEMKLGDSGERVAALQQRLLISGELQEINDKGEFDNDLEKAVILFQENNGLYDDGIVESDTLAALNIPIKDRIQQMELNLDKMRWLPTDLGNEYVMVNIPDYSLNIQKDGKSALSMDVAVGGSDHPSCVLTSQISHVVIHPYWNMPTDIAATELWPQLRKDKNFLAKKHIQVLQKDKSGNYVEINPDKINWSKLTPKEFNSYRYRQDPGTDNSLGKVKFMFANPCQIYLHDTNESQVFEIYRRDFSHGCIRVGEPQTLANYILTKEDGWNKKKVSRTFKTGENKTITLTNPLNLYLVYFTAWDSNDDWVQFRNDIYKLDKPKKYPVYLPKPQVKQDDDN